MATAGIIHTTHASFLREPGAPDPLRPARRSICLPAAGPKSSGFGRHRLQDSPANLKAMPAEEASLKRAFDSFSN